MRTGPMGGVEHEIGQVTAVAAGHVLEGFQLRVLDTGSGSLNPVSRAGDDHFARPLVTRVITGPMG